MELISREARELSVWTEACKYIFMCIIFSYIFKNEGILYLILDCKSILVWIETGENLNMEETITSVLEFYCICSEL